MAPLPEGFPDVLRELVEAELAAGNTIAEVGVGFPSPPVGGWVRLEKLVSTRPREATPELDFYERNMPSYSGEFTDAKRYFFVLEPPHPPPPEPDMDAIRAKLNMPAGVPNLPAPLLPRGATPVSTPRVEEFRASMSIDYDKWREGIGYDITLIGRTEPDERAAIEDMLTSRRPGDWRDIEALAALDTPRARELLRNALSSGDHRLTTAVQTYAPWLLSEDERIQMLCQALAHGDTYGGLTQALMQVEEFHPPEVVAALWRGLKRSDRTPVHFAAMLMFIHGKAKTSFDWDQRPFFLRFGSDDDLDRREAYWDLCEMLGGDPNDEPDENGERPVRRRVPPPHMRKKGKKTP